MITIIVMLILAGVSINVLFGDNGIMKMVEKSNIRTNEASVSETLKLELNSKKIDEHLSLDTRSDLEYLMQEGFLLNSITNSSGQEYIYTYLEFEIDGTYKKYSIADTRENNKYSSLNNKNFLKVKLENVELSSSTLGEEIYIGDISLENAYLIDDDWKAYYYSSLKCKVKICIQTVKMKISVIGDKENFYVTDELQLECKITDKDGTDITSQYKNSIIWSSKNEEVIKVTQGRNCTWSKSRKSQNSSKCK